MTSERSSRQRSGERWCRLVLQALAISFAVVASAFLLFPDGTIRAMNAAGAWFGDYAPAPDSELRFWLSLATGYMVLVTALAYLAQRDLRRHRLLLLLLALGKATTSLTSYAFFARSSPAFIYLANFLVDGSIALTAGAIWLAVPFLGPPPSGGGRAAGRATSDAPPAQPAPLSALLEAMIPSGGPFAEGMRETQLVSEVHTFVGSAETGAGRGLRLGAQLLDLVPLVLPPLRRRRFSRLPLRDRIDLLEAWEHSGPSPLRQALHAYKVLATSCFYSRPEVEARLGYPQPLVRVPRAETAQ